MEYRLQITPKLCIGCKTCELSCSFSHMQGSFQPGRSRIHVFPTGPEKYFQMVCLQCDDAVCAKACPVEAIAFNDGTGAYEINQEKCIRCRACVTACPFGNIVVQETDGAIIKCDLCGGNPLCAKYCPTQALDYVPIRLPARAAG